MKPVTRNLLVIGLFLLGAHAYAATATNSISEAHKAYLERDFGEMTKQMKAALMEAPGDQVILENVLGLYSKAFDLMGDKGLPTDWYLPDEISHFRVSVRVRENTRRHYSIGVGGHLQEAGLISQLQLIQYPDRIILDKTAGIGNWEETNPKEPEFNFRAEGSRRPVESGLYLLKVELTNGKRVDGWFIVDPNLNSSDAPVVHSPKDQQVFITDQPTFRWQDFRSPENRGYETRGLWIGVSRSEPPQYEWQELWYLWQRPIVITEATIGKSHDGVGVEALENGNYVFVVNFIERKKFGDIYLSRDSQTQKNFKVKK